MIREIASHVGGASNAASGIAKNIGESAGSLSDVSVNISGLNMEITDSANGIKQIKESTEALAKLATGMQSVVQQFKV